MRGVDGSASADFKAATADLKQAVARNKQSRASQGLRTNITSESRQSHQQQQSKLSKSAMLDKPKDTAVNKPMSTSASSAAVAANRRLHQTPNNKGRVRLFSAKPSGITSYQVVNSTTHQEEQSSNMMPSVQAMLAYENLQQSPTSASDLLSMPP